MLADVAAAGEEGAYVGLVGGGYVPAAHFAPVPGDLVAIAGRLTGVPYLWGGRTARGIDCSGLVQLAMAAAGLPAPRDSDMQAALIGKPLDPEAPLQRGDLVFWRGHVGILTDADRLLHANAHAMAVAEEPLAEAVARIAASGGGPVTARRRPDRLSGN
jgi:cell wall-associated NlpC family hydrolase